MRSQPLSALLGLACAVVLPAAAIPQTQSSPTPTLHVNSRAVLTDVVVTDSSGKAVHGLPASAFHITDNNRPQRLNAFEEHSGAAPAPPPSHTLPSGVVTNANFLHAPAVSNALLIDTTNMDIVDQMFLYQRLTHFIQDLPPGVPIAIFLRAFDYSVMLQDFTADHAALLVALRKAIPHPQLASGAEMHEIAGLVQVAGYLSQMPGRKNLLWFNGGSTEFTHPGPWSNLSSTGAGSNTDGSVAVDTDSPGFFPTDYNRMFYDLLDSARIALYPVDVRGLSPQMTGATDNQHLNELSFAEATGGEGFYNENNLTLVAEKAMQNGDSFYTLSYSPNDLRNNGSWHTVHVAVDGAHYNLSYRRGYYDDSSDTPHALMQKSGLLKVGNQQIDAPNPRSRPLIFRARVEPGPPGAATHNNRRPCQVHFDIPAVELEQTVADGKGTSHVGAAVIAFNQAGQPIGHVSQQVTLNFEEALFREHPLAALSFDQQIDLPKKEEAYLYIAVWDTATGRMGTIDVPFNPTQVASR